MEEQTTTIVKVLAIFPYEEIVFYAVENPIPLYVRLTTETQKMRTLELRWMWDRIIERYGIDYEGPADYLLVMNFKFGTGYRKGRGWLGEYFYGRVRGYQALKPRTRQNKSVFGKFHYFRHRRTNVRPVQ